MFGKTVSNKALTQLKALTTPTFTVNINNTTYTLAVTQQALQACTGLTQVASLLQNLLQDTLATSAIQVIGNNQFLVGADSLDANTTISYCTGNVADILNLSQAKAPTLSQGVIGGNATENMDAIINANANWITLSYATRLENDTQNDDYGVTIGLTEWIASQDNDYLGLWWEGIDSDATADSMTMWQVLVDAGYGEYFNNRVIYNVSIQVEYNGQNTINPVTNDEIGVYAGFVSGMGASIDYNQRNAKLNFAGKTQAGLATNTKNTQEYLWLIQHGYNVYGQFATPGSTYDLSENGSIGGSLLWSDNIFDRKWLFKGAIQNQLMSLIQNTKRLPYNAEGQAMVNAVLGGVAQQGLNNGVIETGNSFSQAQIQAIIEKIGTDVSPILSSAGCYIYFPPITAEQRNARAPLQVSFLYTNGGCINSINVSGIFIQ